MNDLKGRELLKLFVEQYKDGAQGCRMDYETAQALAVAISELLCA